VRYVVVELLVVEQLPFPPELTDGTLQFDGSGVLQGQFYNSTVLKLIFITHSIRSTTDPIRVVTSILVLRVYLYASNTIYVHHILCRVYIVYGCSIFQSHTAKTLCRRFFHIRGGVSIFFVEHSPHTCILLLKEVLSRATLTHCHYSVSNNHPVHNIYCFNL